MVLNQDLIDSPRLSFPPFLLPVKNNLTAPPANPQDGDRYRVKAVASGLWIGKQNTIAIWSNKTKSWIFQPLQESQIWYDFTSQDWHYMSHAGVITQYDKIPLSISDTTGLQAALDSKALITHAANHVSGGSDPLTGLLDANARISVLVAAAVIAIRRKINFIAGTNISLAAVDNNAQERVDLTINSTASTLTNFDDSLFTIFNHADPTKISTFDASLITAGQTRNYLLPDITGKTFSMIDYAELWSATKTSSVNGDVLISNVDGQGNIGNDLKRFALVRAVIVSSGDLILSDRKTGKKLYALHEDKRGIYFSDYKSGKTRMFLDMKNGNLKITGKITQNAVIAKTFKKPKTKVSPCLKRNLRGSK